MDVDRHRHSQYVILNIETLNNEELEDLREVHRVCKCTENGNVGLPRAKNVNAIITMQLVQSGV